MVRRSSRLQAGNYYTLSNGRNSPSVATVSYYETPVRYMNLNSHVCGSQTVTDVQTFVCFCSRQESQKVPRPHPQTEESSLILC